MPETAPRPQLAHLTAVLDDLKARGTYLTTSRRRFATTTANR